MNIFTSFEESHKKPLSFAIGNFDGIHKGHSEILKKAIDSEKSESAVITFYPHPRQYLYPDFTPHFITSLPEKLSLFEVLGINNVFILPFGKMVNMEPVDFLNYLSDHTLPTAITVGFNFFFGRNQKGNTELLHWWSKGAEIKVNIIDPVRIGGLRISSTAVRELIAEGEVEKSSKLTEFPYFLSGFVRKNSEAAPFNFDFPAKNKIVPPDGFYQTLLVQKNNQTHCLAELKTIFGEKKVTILKNNNTFSAEFSTLYFLKEEASLPFNLWEELPIEKPLPFIKFDYFENMKYMEML